MCQIINDGTCPNAMANAEPGHLSHARWLTTANRILRVYISSNQPSNELDISEICCYSLPPIMV